MNEENQRLIKQTVIELLGAMGMNVSIEKEEIESIEGGDEIFTIDLNVENPNLLIGQYGSNLQSIQHLTGVIVKRKIMNGNYSKTEIDNEFKFNIDVNGYKRQRKKSLIKLAETMANQVIYSKNSVALRPMSSYERRIIHTEISGKKNLISESIGENLTRRVVIKYVEKK